VNIPIENVYYLLCYAWRHPVQDEIVSVQRLGGFSRVEDLFGLVLAEGTFRLVRQGIDRGYLEHEDDLAGIRGRILMGATLKRALRARGRVACRFEELSQDVLHNRIIRSTLGTLLKLNRLAPDVRQEVRLAYQKLEGVSPMRLSRVAFRQVHLDRNRSLYRFLIQLCELLHGSMLVHPESGKNAFRDFRRDQRAMWRLFEAFVAEFLAREQSQYVVRAQARIPWQEPRATMPEHLTMLPGMAADVVLEGPVRRIVLETKFYAEPLAERFGSFKVRSSNLYQILSYVRNREATSPAGPRHEGLLLYPVVAQAFAMDFRLEGFRIQVRSIDLNQPWQRIHEDLLGLVA
jgi:5-methylcytosine-specific restriction enzyme subunit McrC